ncbi:hypothetical protein K1719_012312 [Acacia pycnantha]|nr:hypothetical protein K1719_012312 [Acacia pycnantha]
MTLVYGSLNIVQRRELWQDLKQISRSTNVPWCVGGDMNATLSTDERYSWRSSRGPDRDFCRFVEEVALNDLGFIGPPFTWRRTGVASRLDQVLGSSSWLEIFPNAAVKHLNWYKSDHRPLLLQLDGFRWKQRGERPFRFLAAWVLNERFSPFVSESWRNDLAWGVNVDQFTTACEKWNGQVFGHTTARKRQLLRRLNGITRTEERFGLTRELEDLQKSLWQQLDEVLVQESLIWAQKARSEWLVDGDRNTRFFHSRANGRRKRNFIGALKGEDEAWVYDCDRIKEMVVSHFSTVFREEQARRPTLCCSVSFPGWELGEERWQGRVVAGSLVDTQSGVVRWKHERSGVFSIKSAYDVMNASPEGEERSWQHLWKMGIVPRCKSFMWLAYRINFLLTKNEETRQLWVAVVDPRYLHRFFQSELLGWIRGNMHRVQDRGKEDWGVLFCTLCWMIWQRRNSRIFENVILSNEAILYRANSIIATMKSARDRMRGVNLNGRAVGIRDEVWEPPDRGWVKCNVDGASTHDLLATCGGFSG